MKHFLLALLLFLPLSILQAQKYEEVEKVVSTFPNKLSSHEKLTQLIQTNFKTEEDRAAAAYIWIASNIRYDFKALKHIEPQNFKGKSDKEIQQKMEEFKVELAERTIKRELGVCFNYAQLYHRICQLMGLKSEVVTGFCMNEISDLGKIPK